MFDFWGVKISLNHNKLANFEGVDVEGSFQICLEWSVPGRRLDPFPRINQENIFHTAALAPNVSYLGFSALLPNVTVAVQNFDIPSNWQQQQLIYERGT